MFNYDTSYASAALKFPSTPVDFFILRTTLQEYMLYMSALSYQNTIVTKKLFRLAYATDPMPTDTYSASSSATVSATNDYKNAENTRNLAVPTDTS